MNRQLPIALTLLLAACGGKSNAANDTLPAGSDTPEGTAGEAAAAPPACAEDDAGDALGSAKALALGSHKGCLLTSEDFYSVRAPDHAPGTAFKVETTGASGFMVALFDSKKNEIASGPSGSAIYVAVAGGTDVVVRVSRPDGTPAGSYEIAVNAQPLIDEDEPNDTAKEAKPLNLGQTHDGLLQSVANNAAVASDFFRVLVGRRGQMSIEVDPGTDELTIDVSLLKENGEEIERTQAANAGGTVKLSARVRSGEYWIKVAPAKNEAGRATAIGTRPRFWSESYSISVDVK